MAEPRNGPRLRIEGSCEGCGWLTSHSTFNSCAAYNPPFDPKEPNDSPIYPWEFNGLIPPDWCPRLPDARAALGRELVAEATLNAAVAEALAAPAPDDSALSEFDLADLAVALLGQGGRFTVSLRGRMAMAARALLEGLERGGAAEGRWPVNKPPRPLRFRVPLRIWNRLKASDAMGIERGDAIVAGLRAYLRAPLAPSALPSTPGGAQGCRWTCVVLPEDLRPIVEALAPEHREQHMIAALLRYWRIP